MLDVRRLRLLVELAHRGTIVAVAQALAFTPSAVSQQLSALEREAGLPLLERTGRTVTLTPAGRGLVEHASLVLAQLERARADLDNARAGLAGPVRIGTFPSAGRTLLASALAGLASAHPALTPHLVELDPAAVADALRAGTLDVALVHDYDLTPALDEPLLWTEPMYLAAPSPTPDLASCRDAAWIVATPGTECRRMTERACAAAGFEPSVRHQVDDFATVLALVAAGQGVALVPELGVADPPAGVVLTRMPLSRRTRLAHRPGASQHPAVRAVATAFRAAAAGR
ncbi:LysR family transcriptional regulator [Amycolatopsis sp. NPDC051903]|uniref:LysR family transcriptional regulator n=1 Tax=Amycolatopsis sp. NPDC051903 TaxID=3363936 RepID=UPI0037AB4CA9